MTSASRCGSGLSASIVAVVTAHPGITTNVLCREVKARKAVVLAQLEALRREQLLRFENGNRASKSWYLVAGQGNQFPSGSWARPAPRLRAEGGSERRDRETEA
jgi:hypothetical protein